MFLVDNFPRLSKTDRCLMAGMEDALEILLDVPNCLGYKKNRIIDFCFQNRFARLLIRFFGLVDRGVWCKTGELIADFSPDSG